MEPEILSVLTTSYEGEKSAVTDLPNGRGTAVFSGADGASHTYTGTWTDGVMHGEGEYVWADGVRYKGEFVKNAVTGEGCYTWPSGAVYRGSVRRGLRHGTGSLVLLTGERYQGEWCDGQRHGSGTLWYGTTDRAMSKDDVEATDENGGDDVDNAASVAATASAEDTTTSVTPPEDKGESGYPSGTGVISHVFNGDAGVACYTGEWQRDRKHGRGCMKYASGNVYEGTWVDDTKQGQGTMSWICERERYRGEWCRGKPNGKGVMVWYGNNTTKREMGFGDKDTTAVDGSEGNAQSDTEDGGVTAAAAGGADEDGESQPLQYSLCNRYEGDFVDGERDGQGVFYYSTGAMYAGDFMRGAKHGHGVFTFEDGTVRECDWSNDRPVLLDGTARGLLKPDTSNVKLFIDDLLAPQGGG